MLQQNMVTTVKACCIIHGKVCCNSLMQWFLATRVYHCNNLLQHQHTIATICCNTSTPLQQFVATQATLLLQHQPFCFNHVITYVVMSYVYFRGIKKTYKYKTLYSIYFYCCYPRRCIIPCPHHPQHHPAHLHPCGH